MDGSDAPMDTPPRLAVFPVYRDNPYINLMLLAPRAAGWQVHESARLDRFASDIASMGIGDVAHVHWTSPVVQRADSPQEGLERLRSFEEAIDRARERGVIVVWTVHNALPHDLRHHALEVELNEYLAATADVIHVMHSMTADVVRDDYVLPDSKVEHIPHPSYRGVYESGLSREAARRSFDLSDDETAVMFFGQVRPYKGVDVLINALGQIEPAERFVLLLAGKTAPEDAAVLDKMIPASLRTILHHDFVRDGDVERWFAAADTIVLPYRRILNSGTLHLAASHSVPTVLPDEPHLRSEFGSEPWISWFRPGNSDHLTEILQRGDRTNEGARAFADRLAPYGISRRYLALLQRVTARSPSL